MKRCHILEYAPFALVIVKAQVNKVSSGTVVEPVLQLRPVCLDPHQVYLAKSLDSSSSELLQKIDTGLRASSLAPQVRWTLRTKKTYLYPGSQETGQQAFKLGCAIVLH